MPQDEKFVAVVYENGEVYDHTYNWQSAQSYAQAGYRVMALADDHGVTRDEAQRLYDWERACHADCFGSVVA